MISSMTASSPSTRNTPKADSSFKGYDRIEEIILKKVSRNIRKDAFTIEEIYNQESELPSSLVVLPPSRLALTPRSKEACQRHGINPEVLRRRKPPELDGAKLEIDSMRYEAQTRVREEMMGLARKERERLVSMEEFIPYSAKKNSDKTVSLALSSGETIVEKSTMEQIEEKRLAKIKRRQEKEIEQMITQKAKLQETFEETRAREEHLARKEEKRRRQEKRRERIVAEERRLKELQKRAQMQAERDLQARIAEKMQEIEEQTANERRKMEEQRLAKKREIEETKKKMSEAHKLRTERALAKKQECLRAKANKREQKERERLLKMNDQREKEKNAVAKIQEEKNLIMSANRKGAKLREKERKEKLLMKKDEYEKRRVEQLVAQDSERLMKLKLREMMEQNRTLQLKAVKDQEKDFKEMMRSQLAEEDLALEQLREKREKEADVKKEKKKIKQELKMENVERIRRKNEYRQQEIVKKISANDKRTEEIKRKKTKISERRKKNMLLNIRQKDQIMKLMDQCRTGLSWEQSVRKLEGVLSSGTGSSSGNTLGRSKIGRAESCIRTEDRSSLNTLNTEDEDSVDSAVSSNVSRSLASNDI